MCSGGPSGSTGTRGFTRKGDLCRCSGKGRHVSGGTMAKERRIRVMVAKPGLDGHDRGARIIARAFRDAGFEVVYTGLHQTPEEIVEAAIQEDVDMIGLSSLAGAHNYLFPRVVELLREKQGEDIVVCGGGIFPEEDIPKLKKAGIAEIFTPGTTLETIVAWVRSHVKPRQGGTS